jgi:hypothetical protein
VLDSVSELNTERYMEAMASTEPAIPSVLTEVVEKIRQEAFAAGWKAAVTEVVQSLTNLTIPEGVSEYRIEANEISGPSISRPGDPKTGSTPWYVLQAIRKRQGMTGAEVVSVVQDGGHKVSEASIRTSLIRMERRKLIESRHKRWYPKGA